MLRSLSSGPAEPKDIARSKDIFAPNLQTDALGRKPLFWIASPLIQGFSKAFHAVLSVLPIGTNSRKAFVVDAGKRAFFYTYV